MFLKSSCVMAGVLLLALSCAYGLDSPKEQASISVDGKKITIDYAAPSVHGRKIFGPGGRISQDPNFPVWRAGANTATALHTDADLQIGNLSVPKGDYTLYVSLADTDHWVLIISKQTGQWGLTYNQDHDLGRVKMDMSKPSRPVETLKYTLSKEGQNKVKLELAWDQYEASVPVTVT
jgi:Protein of unknown function (DUF2911)